MDSFIASVQLPIKERTIISLLLLKVYVPFRGRVLVCLAQCREFVLGYVYGRSCAESTSEDSWCRAGSFCPVLSEDVLIGRTMANLERAIHLMNVEEGVSSSLSFHLRLP